VSAVGNGLSRSSGENLSLPVYRRPAVVLVALVGLSMVLRILGALQVPSPWMTPDEQTYAALGRSFWLTGHLAVLGSPAPYLSLAYPLLIGAPLSLHDAHLGYALAKALDAMVMSLAAVAVYGWGVRLMSRGWALVAAGLTLALPGLAYSDFLMTETLFYPVLVLAAWASAAALARPTLRNQALLLGALALAVATRLQAVVLVPAFVLALLLYLTPGRRFREARAFIPSLVALAVVTVAWLAASTGRGRSPLGAYGVVGTTGYALGNALKFAVYHLADLILVVALVPAVALVLLLLRARREPPPPAEQAFLAVAVAFTVGLVAEVGLFTSRNLGRLGERYLLGLAPLFFLAFALWLSRERGRDRVAATLAGVVAVALLALLPARFFSAAAQPEAFTVIPLYHLSQSTSTDPRVFLLGVAGALALAVVVVPARLAVWLVGAVAALLVAVSVYANGVVSDQARAFQRIMVGPKPTWVDSSTAGPVTLVYAGEQGWSGGSPIWLQTFWNRNIRHVYVLNKATVFGPMPTTPVTLDTQGRLVVNGTPIAPPIAVTGAGVRLAGAVPSSSPDGSWRLWRPSVAGPGVELNLVRVDAPSKLTINGPARQVVAHWGGKATFPVTALAIPSACPRRATCPNVEYTWYAKTSPLVLRPGLQCLSTSHTAYSVTYSVWLQDSLGRVSTRSPVLLHCQS
jgi:hypothetical protein